MAYISLNDQYINQFVHAHELVQIQPMINTADQLLRSGTGAGHTFRGFLNWPVTYDKLELQRIKDTAALIQHNSEIFISIGIGGSYLGQRMAIAYLNGNFYNDNPNRHTPQILYAGNSLSSAYLADLLTLLDGHDFAVNVISKSGTTLEPSLAWRVLKQKLQVQYGDDEIKNHLFITTDRQHGALKAEALAKGYQTFVIPDDIGGRFSVLTPVGLLPIAVAGGDITQLLQGAADARLAYHDPDIMHNDAYRYAALRNILYRKGYAIELLESYEPNLHYFSEWWKQLMGESEGKDGKGIYPSAANFTTDLHSLGQYIQDGRRILMETVLNVAKVSHDLSVPTDADNYDGLNYLAGRSINQVNHTAYTGVIQAHLAGGVPVMSVDIPELSAYSLGYLIYFFEIAAAISGYLNGINPFDQPGVEAYKKNMFALLKHDNEME